MGMDDLDGLGKDDDGNLYWRGERITRVKLGRQETVAAWVVAGSSAVLAVCAVLGLLVE